MIDLTQIPFNAEVVGADGVHVGVIDHVTGDRLKLVRADSADGLYHFVDCGLIAGIDDGKVRLSANADVAVLFEQIDAEQAADDKRLDEGLEETFPASDPVSATHIT